MTAAKWSCAAAVKILFAVIELSTIPILTRTLSSLCAVAVTIAQRFSFATVCAMVAQFADPTSRAVAMSRRHMHTFAVLSALDLVTIVVLAVNSGEPT
jgi:hypothetical protein